MVNELSDVAHLESMIFTLLNLKRDAPGQVSQILARLAEGSLMVQMQTIEAQNVARIRNRRTLLVVLAVIALSISMLLTAPALPQILGVSLAWPIGITLVGLYIEIWRQWRRLQKS